MARTIINFLNNKPVARSKKMTGSIITFLLGAVAGYFLGPKLKEQMDKKSHPAV